ncbi:MAG: hypothetical protein FWD05_12210 [Oscillospiraceae bacterium]|nr:hypothetical protein [Oscillospiraceae bacterium]
MVIIIMKLKKLISITLCAVMLTIMLVGCSDSDYEADVPEDDGNAVLTDTNPDTDPDVDDTHGMQLPVSIDFEAAFAAFEPDTVMVRAGDLTVVWAELYVFLFNAVNELLGSFDMGADWSDVLVEDLTLADVTLGRAVEEAVQYLIFEYGSYVTGVTLSAEDLSMLSAEVDNLVEMYGDREELSAVLRAFGGFYSIELFESMIRKQHLLDVLMRELYGMEAELFPDESTTMFAEREGFMMAKHILRLRDEVGEGTALGESEAILEQLNAYDGDDIIAYFDALMHIHSEDTGIFNYPHGYLFQFPDMVVPFSQASAGLQVGQFSDIVVTDFGYHIILRIPINYDIIPIGQENLGQLFTLRQLAASEDLNSVLQGWRDELIIEFTPEFESIYIADIFELIHN